MAERYCTHREKGEYIAMLAMLDTKPKTNALDSYFSDKETKKEALKELDKTIQVSLKAMYKSHSIQSVEIKENQASVKVKVRQVKVDTKALKSQLIQNLLPYLFAHSISISELAKSCREDILSTIKEGKVTTQEETIHFIKKNGDWKIQAPDYFDTLFNA